MKIKTINSIFIMLLTLVISKAHAEIGSIKANLAAQGCQILAAEKYGISMQFQTSYEKGIIDAISEVKNRDWTTYQCNEQKAGVITLDFTSEEEAKTASSFVKGFIWGENGPSSMHPERIYLINESIVLVSSKSSTLLDKALEKLAPVKTPLNELIENISSILQCTNTPGEECNILKEFQQAGEPTTLNPQYFTVAFATRLNKQGKIIAKEPMVLMTDNKSSVISLDLYNPSPENDEERKSVKNYIDLINQGKRDNNNMLHQYLVGDLKTRKLIEPLKLENTLFFAFKESATSSTYKVYVRELNGLYYVVAQISHLGATEYMLEKLPVVNM